MCKTLNISQFATTQLESLCPAKRGLGQHNDWGTSELIPHTRCHGPFVTPHCHYLSSVCAWRPSFSAELIKQVTWLASLSSEAQALILPPPDECYCNTLLYCDYFSSTSVVSCAFSALCMYSKFGHHRHFVGYLCAKFCFFPDFHCWASPWRKIMYSINHSPSFVLNHSPSLFDVPGTEALALWNITLVPPWQFRL